MNTFDKPLCLIRCSFCCQIIIRFAPRLLQNLNITHKIADAKIRKAGLTRSHHFTRTAYLQVLTNETTAYSAELNLAQARANELIALAQIYQALGGGWE